MDTRVHAFSAMRQPTANDPPVPPPPGLTILHARDRYVVIDKPPGLLSVPGKGPANQDCVVSRLREAIPSATGPLVVHRLDMDTSGLLVLGLDASAQRDLSRQFERRRVEKQYVALVDGLMPSERGQIDVPMRADITRRPIQIIDRALGRPSRTSWELLALETDRSRLRLHPHTGRTHQLRVHMAHIGHPILGDVLYGDQPRTASLAPRLCLHASLLAFHEPGTEHQVRFESRAPF